MFLLNLLWNDFVSIERIFIFSLCSFFVSVARFMNFSSHFSPQKERLFMKPIHLARHQNEVGGFHGVVNGVSPWLPHFYDVFLSRKFEWERETSFQFFMTEFSKWDFLFNFLFPYTLRMTSFWTPFFIAITMSHLIISVQRNRPWIRIENNFSQYSRRKINYIYYWRRFNQQSNRCIHRVLLSFLFIQLNWKHVRLRP